MEAEAEVEAEAEAEAVAAAAPEAARWPRWLCPPQASAVHATVTTPPAAREPRGV